MILAYFFKFLPARFHYYEMHINKCLAAELGRHAKRNDYL